MSMRFDQLWKTWTTFGRKNEDLTNIFRDVIISILDHSNVSSRETSVVCKDLKPRAFVGTNIRFHEVG